MDTGNEKWRTEGFFWIEKDETNQIPGSLICLLDGTCELHLQGVFADSFEGLSIKRRQKIPPIVGSTKMFRRVTLIDPIENQRTITFTEGHTSSLTARRVLTSSSLNSLSSTPLLKLRASIEGFDKWLGISGFDIYFDPNKHQLSSTFTLPEAIEFQIDPTLKLSFGFGTNGLTRTWPQFELSMRQKTYLGRVHANG